MDIQHIIIPEFDVSSIETLETAYAYWAFPEVISTFGYSKPTSQLLKLIGTNASWYLRAEKTVVTLIWWEGCINRDIYDEMSQYLVQLGFKKLGSVLLDSSIASLGLDTVKVPVWYSYHSWHTAPISSNKRWQIKKAYRKFTFVPVSRDISGLEDMSDVLVRWREKAQHRHFMVVMGHYRQVIRSHSHFERSHMFLVKNQEQQNVGLVGGYVYPNRSVIVNAKHDYSDPFLAVAIWGYWMEYVHQQLEIPICNCGDTADGLKFSLGMEKKYNHRFPKRGILS